MSKRSPDPQPVSVEPAAKPWVRPELLVIKAGDAEAKTRDHPDLLAQS